MNFHNSLRSGVNVDPSNGTSKESFARNDTPSLNRRRRPPLASTPEKHGWFQLGKAYAGGAKLTRLTNPTETPVTNLCLVPSPRSLARTSNLSLSF